jgi:hypothetical protein
MSMPVEDLTNSQEEKNNSNTSSGSMEDGLDSKHGGDADSDGEPLDGLSGDKKKSRPNPPSPTKGFGSSLVSSSTMAAANLLLGQSLTSASSLPALPAEADDSQD